MHTPTQHHESKNTIEETLKHLNELIELAKKGILDNSEVETIRNLATKNRETNLTQAENSRDLSGGEDKKSEGTMATNIVGELNAKSLLEDIKQGQVGYAIFGTNGKTTGHELQKTNTNGVDMGFCDPMLNVNSSIQNDPNNLFLRIFPEKIPGYATIALRVADNRVDRRPGSHTTVILFIKGVQDSIKLETLAKNTEELKDIMRAILERQNSPLRGAEEKVTRSFLI